MNNRLYHRKVFWPANLRLHTGKFQTRLTFHARSAELNDRYGEFSIPSSFEATTDNIFEVELNQDGKAIKQCCRLTLDSTRDIIIAFIPEGNTAVVKTAWINLKSDKHHTLKSHLYSRR